MNTPEPPAPAPTAELRFSVKLQAPVKSRSGSAVHARLRRMFRTESLAGVLVALASPLQHDGTVDEPAVARLVEHVLAGGVRGLVGLGSTGEAARVGATSRRQLLDAGGKAA